MPKLQVIIAFILLAIQATVLHAQTPDILPGITKLTNKQRTELFDYFEKAPVLEKFYLMTSSAVGSGIMHDLADLKTYKYIKSNSPPYKAEIETIFNDFCFDTIDYKNGYIRFNAYQRMSEMHQSLGVGQRALTYWKYGDGMYLIASQHVLNCTTAEGPSDIAEFPEFFRYDGKKMERVPHYSIIKTQSPINNIYGQWYDVCLVEEYLIAAAIGDENSGYPPYIDMRYDLPQQGRDICIRLCGEPGNYTNDYLAYYIWQGDGTFLKVGRNDDFIRELYNKKSQNTPLP